jgi:hypothetical protein
MKKGQRVAWESSSMTYGPLSDVLRHIRRIALTAEAAELDDGRLVERFLASRDEAAFEALLRRHGPMVLSVCRRLLRDPHDTEEPSRPRFWSCCGRRLR